MKNFLVRLAQRSIGQVPVVRSRVMLAPPVIGGGAAVPMAEAPMPPAHPSALVTSEAPPPVAAAVHISGELPRAIPQPATAPPVAPPQAGIHAIHTTRVITEVIERPMPAGPGAPIEHDGQETRPPADLRDQPQIVPRPIQPATVLAIQTAVPPIAVPDMTVQAPVPAPIATRGDAELAVDRSPALRPASIEFITPRHEPLDTTEPTDRTVTMTPASRHQPPLPGQDAVSPVLPPAKVLPPSQERVVQVRIGTIEIRAPQPPPPAPIAAPMPRSLPRGGGFDEFARLRSYAPWEW
jgi:hypothetical protein